MYLDHYGLKQTPFSITPDPGFVFLSDRHRDALAHLIYGISQGGGGGFVQLTGEVGTGKTTLSRLLLEQLPVNTRVALVLNPRLDPTELLEVICQELGVDISHAHGSGKALVDALNRYLLDAHAQHLKVVLILDEAQQMTVASLEQVRLLTNLETATDKLLQIVLLGQPELREMLDRPDLRQLSQRITARFHLTPLETGETADYVRHRLAVAGLKRSPFTARALKTLHRRSGGVPRLINVIAERALLAGYARDLDSIDARLVDTAADELLPTRGRVHARSSRHAWLGAVAILALLSAALAWMQQRQQPAAGAVEATPRYQPAEVADLDHLLAAHSDDDAAARALLARWQADPALAPRLADCPFRFDAGGLYCVRTRGTLGQLSVLDRPVLLGIPHAGRLRSIALLRLDSQTATVDIGGVEAVVERSSLESRWPGEYRAPMRLPEDVGAVQAALPDWARQALTRFEANRTLPPLSNDDDRIRRLQQDHGLRADSIIGPETWWVMSAQLDGGPRLRSSMPIDASR